MTQLPQSPKDAPPSITEKAREFHLKEWEFLRTDVRTQIEHSKSLEFATVVALAAFYAWYLTLSKPIPKFVLILPTLLVFLGALRSLALSATFSAQQAIYGRWKRPCQSMMLT